MSHEGSHYYGNRVEGVAHLQGLSTYAELANQFKLKGDSGFAKEMFAGITNMKNWVENTGDTDYWRLAYDGTLINDNQGYLKDENGKYVNKDGSRTDQPVEGQTLGYADGNVETGLLNIMFGRSGDTYNNF